MYRPYGMGMSRYPLGTYGCVLAPPFRPPPFRGPPMGCSSDSSSSSSDCDCDDCRAPRPHRRHRVTWDDVVMNDHPFPTHGRDLGPIHQAAQAENITFSHIRGCHRRGACEERQRRKMSEILYQRGINHRNPRLTLRQVLRVTRGYDKGAPDPTPSAAELQQAAAPAPAPALAPAPQLPPAPHQAQLLPAPGGALFQAGSVMRDDGGSEMGMMGGNRLVGGRHGEHAMEIMGGDRFGGDPRGGMGRRQGGRRSHEQFGGSGMMFQGGGWRGREGSRPDWAEDDEEEDDGWLWQSHMGRQRY